MNYDIETIRRNNTCWTHSDFVFFWGHNDRDAKLTKACLSQWFSCYFEVEGQYYNCAEQFMIIDNLIEQAKTKGQFTLMRTDDSTSMILTY